MCRQNFCHIFTKKVQICRMGGVYVFTRSTSCFVAFNFCIKRRCWFEYKQQLFAPTATRADTGISLLSIFPKLSIILLLQWKKVFYIRYFGQKKPLQVGSKRQMLCNGFFVQKIISKICDKVIFQKFCICHQNYNWLSSFFFWSASSSAEIIPSMSPSINCSIE